MLDVFRDCFDAHVALEGHTDAVSFPASTWRVTRRWFPDGDGLTPPDRGEVLMPGLQDQT